MKVLLLTHSFRSFHPLVRSSPEGEPDDGRFLPRVVRAEPGDRHPLDLVARDQAREMLRRARCRGLPFFQATNNNKSSSIRIFTFHRGSEESPWHASASTKHTASLHGNAVVPPATSSGRRGEDLDLHGWGASDAEYTASLKQHCRA